MALQMRESGNKFRLKILGVDLQLFFSVCYNIIRHEDTSACMLV